MNYLLSTSTDLNALCPSREWATASITLEQRRSLPKSSMVSW